MALAISAALASTSLGGADGGVAGKAARTTTCRFRLNSDAELLEKLHAENPVNAAARGLFELAQVNAGKL